MRESRAAVALGEGGVVGEGLKAAQVSVGWRGCHLIVPMAAQVSVCMSLFGYVKFLCR